MQPASTQLLLKRSDKLIHILLVERYRLILNALKQLIDADARFSVCGIASNSETALHQVDQCAPTMIILDLDLGEDSGLALITKLRARSSANIAILTGNRDTALHDQAVIAGARGIIGRDDSPNVLFDAIEKIHRGELWLNRDATARLIQQMARGQAPTESTKQKDRLSSLTTKEKKVTRAVILDRGKSLKEVATALFISESTMHKHLGSIYAKLFVANRLELYDIYSDNVLAKDALDAPCSCGKVTKTKTEGSAITCT